eukprot:CAMPEP_0116822626 /NCGR_PEP_ID=MMETSP0418-20121206/370_1 /TAXON_ID=1158023 /ORGANISM="Astrosyne radiata, Strain 13vi08-1A" /LENGTH=69 /DNA_ID=CAMNT_0004450755 /DNA_START=231 /DNA_END=440 /DNA_ORIENTATION=-
MRANDFQPLEEMPKEPPAGDDHPFLQKGGSKPQEYVGELPERKEWQKPLPPQDPKDIFVKVKDKPKENE